MKKFIKSRQFSPLFQFLQILQHQTTRAKEITAKILPARKYLPCRLMYTEYTPTYIVYAKMTSTRNARFQKSQNFHSEKIIPIIILFIIYTRSNFPIKDCSSQSFKTCVGYALTLIKLIKFYDFWAILFRYIE